MLALRYLQILALAVWLGGIVALGAVAAPATFQVLQARDPAQGRTLAGAVFGDILRRFHPITYGCAGIVLLALFLRAVLGPRPIAFGIRAAIVVVMLAVSLYSGIWLTQQIERLQAEIGGPVNALPEGDPRRAQFGRLHGLSTVLMTINLAGVLALLYWEAKE